MNIEDYEDFMDMFFNYDEFDKIKDNQFDELHDIYMDDIPPGDLNNESSSLDLC